MSTTPKPLTPQEQDAYDIAQTALAAQCGCMSTGCVHDRIRAYAEQRGWGEGIAAVREARDVAEAGVQRLTAELEQARALAQATVVQVEELAAHNAALRDVLEAVLPYAERFWRSGEQPSSCISEARAALALQPSEALAALVERERQHGGALAMQQIERQSPKAWSSKALAEHDERVRQQARAAALDAVVAWLNPTNHYETISRHVAAEAVLALKNELSPAPPATEPTPALKPVCLTCMDSHQVIDHAQSSIAVMVRVPCPDCTKAGGR